MEENFWIRAKKRMTKYGEGEDYNNRMINGKISIIEEIKGTRGK